MKRATLAILAFATLTTGCAAMGTKRGGGAQIQRTAEPAQVETASPLGDRADLGQR